AQRRRRRRPRRSAPPRGSRDTGSAPARGARRSRGGGRARRTGRAPGRDRTAAGRPAEGEREAPEREHEQRAECGAVAGGEVVPEDDAREPERGEREERDVTGQHAWAERDERVERDRARRAELALEVVVREIGRAHV